MVIKHKKVSFLGIQISVIGVSELLEYLVEAVHSNVCPVQVNYANVHTCSLARTNERFRQVLNQSEVVFCDGTGVKLGARILGIRLGERMTPPDWIDAFFARCEYEQISVFFLGDEEAVVRLFTETVGSRYPGLQIRGSHHGFFGKVEGGNQRVINLINESGAQVIITGMGQPLQEYWAFENRQWLKARAVLSTGAMFRWYARVERRGPKIFTNNGLEWFWRLLVQPKKVWRRYLIELPMFLVSVIHAYFNRPSQGKALR